MKKIFILLILTGAFLFRVSAATYHTTTTGFWTGNIWTSGSLPTLNDGDILHIDHNVTINSNLIFAADITIIINATLTFQDGGSKIEVGDGSVFQLTSTGRIEGASNSNQIRIGNGPAEWDASDDPIVGPGSFGNGWECPPCTLPVRLLFFHAGVKNATVTLSWATTMEENFSRFVIQRSIDGLSFEDLGEVPGKGFNVYDIQSKYWFEDKQPFQGSSYYRLKAIDLDGTFEHFGVKAVEVDAPKNISVYPNPSTGELIVFTTNFSPQESDRIFLIDPLGEEVFSAMATSNEHTLVFENALKPGVYMLRYVSQGFEQISRVMVTR